MLRLQGNSGARLVTVLSNLAWEYRPRNADTALRYASEAVALARQNADPPALAEALNTLGNMYRFQARYDTAFAVINEARALAETHSLTKELAVALGSLGLLYQERGIYERALEYHTQSLILREELNDKNGIAYSYRNISTLYRLQGDLRSALDYALKSMQIRRESGDSRGLAYILGDIGNIYQALQRSDSALSCHTAALRLADTLGDKQGQASALNNIGVVLAERGIEDTTLREALPEALRYHERAIALRQTLRDGAGLAESFTNKASCFLALREYDAALAALTLASRYADSLSLRPLRQRCYRLFAETYHQLGNNDRAFAFERRYAALKDSIMSEDAIRAIASARTLYQDERKNRQIELLQAERTRQDLLRNALIIGLVAALGAGVWFVVLYRQKEEARRNVQHQNEVLEEQAVEIELANSQLHEQNEQLNALNAEKNELMGIVAHDLKNPIGAVRSLADLIQGGSIESSQVQDISHQIVGTADRMLDLVKNLLDINRLESGAMEFQIVNIHLKPIIDSVFWHYEHAAAKKNITLHFDENYTNDVVLADEQALMQVLDNLVSNAVKYSPEGKNVYVRIKAKGASETLREQKAKEQMSSEPSSFIRLEVADEGQGISKDDMKRLFGKFARLSARPTGGEHSTGLGLSIVKKMVEAMNGRVWCESEFGDGLPSGLQTGATFIVELPAAA